MDLEFIIDTRENEIKKHFESKNIKIEQLDLGDFIFKYKNEIVLIIERKTIKDLSASIKDGRHREQKQRLLNCGINLDCVYYIIEGSYEKNCYLLPKNTLISSIINTMLRDKIKVFRTVNVKDTIFHLEQIYNKLSSDPNKYLSKNTSDYCASLKIKKKENLTNIVCYKLQLSQIPGVSTNIASCISEHYKSMFDLFHNYEKLNTEKEKKEMLMDLKYDIQNNKQRRIGKVVSERIYNFLSDN